MGIPILKGREFTRQDTVSAPGVIVINETMARTYWPKEDPVGRAIRLGGSDGPRLTVVGVAGDVHYLGLDAPVRRQFFRPYTQAGWPVMSVVVRTASAPATFTAPVKKALASVLPDRPVSGVETMEEVVHNSTGSRRFPMLLLSVFSVLALVLAAVGIVGVVGHSVAQRTHEIGIRMALGAETLDVLRLMVNSSMVWVLVGLGGGRGRLGRTHAAAYPECSTTCGRSIRWCSAQSRCCWPPWRCIASYLPARRAARIDPMAALRCE